MFGRIDNEVPDDSIKIGMDMKVHVNNLQADQKNFVFKPV
ncbi:MAG: DNA-binding protein, partial [Desulfobacteraceae bacterium]|nr:DNA-binding protein [Desulfobacteraceae bacterium]